MSDEGSLFDEAGLPGVLADRGAFEQFLMHGFLPMPGGLADGVRFDVDELTPEQRDALRKLVAKYLDAFDDPGIASDFDG